MFHKTHYIFPAGHPVLRLPNENEYNYSDVWVGTGDDRGRFICKTSSDKWIALDGYPRITAPGVDSRGNPTSRMVTLTPSIFSFDNYMAFATGPNQIVSSSLKVRERLSLYHYNGKWVLIPEVGIGFPVDALPRNEEIEELEEQYDIYGEVPVYWWEKQSLEFGDNVFQPVQMFSDRRVTVQPTTVKVEQSVWTNESSDAADASGGMFGHYVPDGSYGGNIAAGSFMIGTAVWKDEETGIEIKKRGDSWNGVSIDEPSGELVLNHDGKIYVSESYAFREDLHFASADDAEDVLVVQWIGFAGERFKSPVKMFEVPKY